MCDGSYYRLSKNKVLLVLCDDFYRVSKNEVLLLLCDGCYWVFKYLRVRFCWCCVMVVTEYSSIQELGYVCVVWWLLLGTYSSIQD